MYAEEHLRDYGALQYSCADFFRTIESHGAAPALHADGTWTSHAELADLADRFAATLPEPRSLIFVQGLGTVAAIAAYLGCLRGGHAVYLHGEGDRARLQQLVDRYRPQAIVSAAGAGVATELLESPPPVLHPDLLVLLSTSGSTGSPKLVMLSETNLAANAGAICSYLGLTAADRAITSLKVHYSYGMSVLHSHLAVGGSLVLTDDPVTSPVFRGLLHDAGVTNLAGVPYTFDLLAADPSWAAAPSLRFVTQAGGRLSPDKVRQLAALGERHGWQFFVMYGQTEAAPRIAWLPPALAQSHPDCIGVPVPGGRLEILDSHGQPAEAAGIEGELAYSGPNVMMGYARGAGDLAHDRTPERLLTGDIALRNANGLFRIVGRSARMVKPFGIRINLDDVQELARRELPGAVCTGDDDRIVIACEADPALAAPIAGAIAARLNLPAQNVRVQPFAQIPVLPSGKPDYRAIMAVAQAADRPPDRPGRLAAATSIVLSSTFYRRALHEAGAILGLVRDEGRDVTELFASLTGRRPASDHETFRSLAADSLTFVQASLALEDLLGTLPEGWEGMTIAELELLRCDAPAL